METNKKAALQQQPANKNSINVSLPLTDYFEQIEKLFSSDVVFLKLRGYIAGNQEQDPKKQYQAAKVPLDKQWTSKSFKGHTAAQLDSWVNQGGWIGLRVPQGYIVVDVDNAEEGLAIHKLLNIYDVKHYAIKTPGGYQFIFKDTKNIKRQNTKVLTELGFIIDYRLAGKGQIVLPLGENTVGREWIKHDNADVEAMPAWFNPLKTINKDEERPFTLPIMEGSRNDILFKHAARLKQYGRSDEEIQSIIDIMGKYLCKPSMDESELSSIVRSVSKYESKVIPFRQSNVPADQIGKSLEDDTPKFDFGDLGNSERFVYYFGDNLKYCFPFKSWFVWNGRRWTLDEKGKVKEYAKTISRKIDEEVVKEDSDSRRDQLRKQAMKAKQKQAIEAMISLSESVVPVLPDELDSDPWLLNVNNGVLNLKTGELMPHDRKYLHTKLVPVDYDTSAECPKWEKFLSEIMQDREGNILFDVIDFLQKAIGYSLTGETTEQCLFFLYGTGKNGKSTFINTVEKILGDYADQTSTDTFLVKNQSSSINNDVAKLKGARFVSAVESEDGKRLAESLIKQLTGGDRVSARFLHKEYFTFKPTFKIFFATNHKPRIRGTDHAIWRRIRLVPFNVTIDDKRANPNLVKELEEELPGILNWAVKGCLKWQQEGLNAPKEVQAATNDYRQEMDSISDFIEDTLFINRQATVPTKSLMEAYKIWCEENSEYEHKKNVFMEKLEEWMDVRGYFLERTRIGHRQIRGWKGIGLLADMPPDMQNAMQEAAPAKDPLEVRKYVENGVVVEEGEI